ncbi:MAG TPA: hypothetical protein VE988_02010 [Gemmataceae bacterium]|nr:hypothetical protein [Gemmataceae bacterium]
MAAQLNEVHETVLVHGLTVTVDCIVAFLPKYASHIHVAVLSSAVVTLRVTAQVGQEDDPVNVNLPLCDVIKTEPKAGFGALTSARANLELRDGQGTVLAAQGRKHAATFHNVNACQQKQPAVHS